jgi:hypothetical protein
MADAEALGITVLYHRRHHDRADRNDCGNAGAGNRGEHRAGRNAGKSEPARQMADQRRRKRDHAPRHPAAGEEGAREDKERDRHDAEIVEAGKQFQADAFNRHFRHREQKRQDGEAERNRDRHARQHQRKQQSENESCAHHASPSAIGASLDTSMPSTLVAS